MKLSNLYAGQFPNLVIGSNNINIAKLMDLVNTRQIIALYYLVIY